MNQWSENNMISIIFYTLIISDAGSGNPALTRSATSRSFTRKSFQKRTSRWLPGIEKTKKKIINWTGTFISADTEGRQKAELALWEHREKAHQRLWSQPGCDANAYSSLLQYGNNDNTFKVRQKDTRTTTQPRCGGRPSWTWGCCSFCSSGPSWHCQLFYNNFVNYNYS